MVFLRQTRRAPGSIDAASQSLLPDQRCQDAGLKATVTLLLVLLMKSKLLRIKMSFLGSILGFALLVGFLLTSGLLTLITGGAVAYAATRSNSN